MVVLTLAKAIWSAFETRQNCNSNQCELSSLLGGCTTNREGWNQGSLCLVFIMLNYSIVFPNNKMVEDTYG